MVLGNTLILMMNVDVFLKVQSSPTSHVTLKVVCEGSVYS
jgi:hypothetical protein